MVQKTSRKNVTSTVLIFFIFSVCLLLILFEAALLVGKHGYTRGFFSLVSLFISGIPGMTDILVTVAI